ncbi:hypothetical protein ACFYZ0_18130 [Streptomyces sp. NPDC001708]|uniref:hypothetical protein n=1 Tax=Streptomyces sp. NPDC001708 TaxID=3364602 RepID=UPI0036968D18
MSAPNPSPLAPGRPFYAFGPFVVLTATVTVGGEPVTVHQQVDRAVWLRIAVDPPLRADYERRLRYDLAVSLVDRLDPTVTVHDPIPRDEAVSNALARADAAMRNEPEPEHCRSLELGSEG